MNIFKRILAILLVCVFVGTALVGCSKKQGNEEPTGSNGTEETEQGTNKYNEVTFDSALKESEFDFDGEKITVMHRSGEIIEREWHKKSPEDELDQAVAIRNATVEEHLNIELNYEVVQWGDYDTSAANFNSKVLDDYNSGTHYYDVIANFAYSATYPSIRDCYANLLDTTEFPWFDFSLPCWNQAIVNKTTVNDRLFYVAGDINLSLFDSAMVIWFNKTLYDEKKLLEEGDADNIQELALKGDWTYDELYKWAGRAWEDSNGQPGKQKDDTYTYATGIKGRYATPADSIPHAWDLEFLVENQDGTHAYNIIGNTKAAEAMTKFRNLYDADGTCEGSSIDSFAAGKYVFFTNVIYPGKQANMTIREMEDKYGILPMPKYDLEQENYGTTATDGYSLMSVIDHDDLKGEAVSAYLQFATEESYTAVRGYYFNRIIKPRYFGTDDSDGTVTNSIKLFDIIVANIEFEFWNIFSSQLNNIAWLWRDTVGKTGNPTIENEFRSNEPLFMDALEKTDEWFDLY